MPWNKRDTAGAFTIIFGEGLVRSFILNDNAAYPGTIPDKADNNRNT